LWCIFCKAWMENLKWWLHKSKRQAYVWLWWNDWRLIWLLFHDIKKTIFCYYGKFKIPPCRRSLGSQSPFNKWWFQYHDGQLINVWWNRQLAHFIWHLSDFAAYNCDYDSRLRLLGGLNYLLNANYFVTGLFKEQMIIFSSGGLICKWIWWFQYHDGQLTTLDEKAS
jgi:hypothetical protein